MEDSQLQRRGLDDRWLWDREVVPLIRHVGGGNIYLRGAVEDVSEVYDNCSLFVQPSASEGFGIEVLEAMAHGRLALLL